MSMSQMCTRPTQTQRRSTPISPNQGKQWENERMAIYSGGRTVIFLQIFWIGCNFHRTCGRPSAFKFCPDPNLKFKMAAKNPRWPPKILFFDIYPSQLLKSDTTQWTKKLHCNILNMLKKKSSKSDNFWVSYGPLKYG